MRREVEDGRVSHNFTGFASLERGDNAFELENESDGVTWQKE